METHKADHASPCTFCELIQGSAEVSICHEDADAIAFMDIQPVNDGHVLVVPREHHESLLDVPEELGIHLFKVTMRLANAIRQVTGCDDMNIVVSSGAAAGQDEPHYHVHIIPRRAGDGFDIPLPFNGSKMPDRTVLDANAVRIIAALRDPMRTESANSAQSAASVDADIADEAITAAPRTERPAAEWRSERPVDLKVFDETGAVPGQRAAASRNPMRWHSDEGAHGELIYEPRADNPG